MSLQNTTMKEWVGVRQIPGEPRRRWFSSSDFDLIVWMSSDAGYTGFELCYDKTRQEQSLMRSRSRGFTHMAVDDGEQRPGGHKQSPILVPGGAFDLRAVYSTFLEASRLLPADVADFVLRTLERHPGVPTDAARRTGALEWSR